MSSECFGRLIERPRGLSGYRPTFWCVVCGRRASPQTDNHCLMENCPNLCHAQCLGEVSDFRCGNTGQLRVVAGINDMVTPYLHITPNNTSLTPPAAADIPEEHQEDDLELLPKEELVHLTRSLRRDLASTKRQLTSYRTVTADLIDKRCVLVEALAVVDTLIATHASEHTQQRSVACSAKPHKITAETGTTTVNNEDTAGVSTSRQPPTSPVTGNGGETDSGSNDQPPSSSTTGTNTRDVTSEDPTPPTPPSSHQVTPSPQTSPPPPPQSSPLPRRVPPTSSSLQQPHPAAEQGPRPPAATEGAEGTGQRHLQQKSRKNRKKKSPKRHLAGGTDGRERTPPTPGVPQPGIRSQLHPTQTKKHGAPRACDYCQGRFHSSLNCRVKLADQRQQELVQAVRQSSQETLSALRSVAWQAQQPASQHRLAGLPPVVPYNSTFFPSPWPFQLPTQHANLPQYQHQHPQGL